MGKLDRHLLSAALLVFSTGAFAQWSTIASGVNDSLTATTFDNGRFTIAGGSGAVLRSFDDGASFSATMGYSTGMGGGFNHLAFFDSLNGVGASTWFCCDLQRTTDGGETWAPWQVPGQSTPWMEPMNDMDAVIYLARPGTDFDLNGHFLPEQQFELYANIDSICNQIYTPGSCTQLVLPSNDTIVQTGGWGWVRLSQDQGYTGDTAVFNYGFYVYRSRPVSGDTVAYLDFDSNLRLSNNKGLDWTPPHLVPGGSSSGTLNLGFDMLTAQHGVAVGSYGLTQVTDDGGASWTPAAPLTNAALRDVQFTDALQVYAVGDSGSILHSSDGGYTWQLEESGTTADLTAITSSPSTVIIVGAEGVILRKDLSTAMPAPMPDPRSLSVYPNPAFDELTITFPMDRSYEGAQLELIDAMGRTILSKTVGGRGPFHVDIHEVRNGHYVLRLRTRDGQHLSSIIVTR